jgi:hypothetical protein
MEQKIQDYKKVLKCMTRRVRAIELNGYLCSAFNIVCCNYLSRRKEKEKLHPGHILWVVKVCA